MSYLGIERNVTLHHRRNDWASRIGSQLLCGRRLVQHEQSDTGAP